MSALWTSTEAEHATGGTSLVPWSADDVSIDTRQNVGGALFCAISDNRDGHEFVGEALKQGAAAAIVSRVPPGLSADQPLLVVDDTLKALGSLGAAARERIDGVAIGVTGSVGKTGTKDMIRLALSGQGRVHAAERSFNNHFGVPLTLARMPRDTTHVVVEIGMNHPGEITPLARLADLDVALVTTVAPVHMAGFDSIDDVARAKAEIFSGLKPGGTAIVNRDIETFGILESAARDAGAKVITFGRSDQADYRLTSVETDGASSVVSCSARGRSVSARLSAPVPHLALNLLGVLAVIDAVGADRASAIDSLLAWQVPQGRGNRFRVRITDDESGYVNVIDESYNASPTSVKAAVEALVISAPRENASADGCCRRVAILGDMLELGPDEQQKHVELARLSALKRIDSIHTVGKLMRGLHDILPDDQRGVWRETSDDLAVDIIDLLAPGDVVMLKGSLGTRIGKVVDAIRSADLDREQSH